MKKRNIIMETYKYRVLKVQYYILSYKSILYFRLAISYIHATS